MRYIIILLLSALALQQQAKAQSHSRHIYYIDSTAIAQLSPDDNLLYKEDIAERRLITHTDTVQQLGFEAGDTIIYIITRAFLNRPDDLRKITALDALSVKEERFYYTDTSSSPYSGPFIEYYLNGTVKTRGEMKDGYIEGYVNNYYRNGTIMTSRYFNQNMEDGIREEYYANGSIQRRGNVINGYMQGFWQEWHSTGRLKSQTRYLNSQPFYEEEGESVFYQLLESARALVRTGKYKDALTRLAQCRLAKPDMEEIYFYCGVAQIGLQQVAEAANAFTEALKIEPLYTQAIRERVFANASLLNNMQISNTDSAELRSLICNDIALAVKLGVNRADFSQIRDRYCTEDAPEPLL